jgi:hypothetical protein
MTQPAISHALSRLRSALHDDLFVRTPEGMAPTPYAERLVGPVRAALENLHTALDGAAPFDPETAERGFTVAMDNRAAVRLAAPLAAADASPEKTPGSIQMLLLVILGALALAGLIGSAVFRFGNLRWIGRRKIQVDRRAIWEQANVNRRFSPVDLDSGARVRRDDIPWELRTADDPNGRIQEMLARLARSAAN